jgi:hypothetical protein
VPSQPDGGQLAGGVGGRLPERLRRCQAHLLKLQEDSLKLQAAGEMSFAQGDWSQAKVDFSGVLTKVASVADHRSDPVLMEIRNGAEIWLNKSKKGENEEKNRKNLAERQK